MKKEKSISKLGYSKGSPFRDKPYLNIETDNGLISMENTDIPLYAVDETGFAKVLQPYSGIHKFLGKTVTEIPIPAAKSGGWLDQYQDGGQYKNGQFKKTFTDKDEFNKAEKAYNDSLSLYSKGISDIIYGKGYPYVKDEKERAKYGQRDYGYYYEVLRNNPSKKISDSKDPLTLELLSNDQIDTKTGDIKPSYWLWGPESKAMPIYKKPVMKPEYKETIRKAIPTFGYDKPPVEPIDHIRGLDGKFIFFEDYHPAVWKRMTNQKQIGGETNPFNPSLKFVKDFFAKQQAADEYTNKATGTTLKQRQDKSGINPNTGKPWATGEAEYIPMESLILPSTLTIKGIGKLGNFIVDAMNPLSGMRGIDDITPKKLVKPKPHVDMPFESQLHKDTRAGMSIIDESDVAALDPDMLTELKNDIMKDNFDINVKPGWSEQINLPQMYPGLAQAPKVNPADELYTSTKDLADDVSHNKKYDQLLDQYMNDKDQSPFSMLFGKNPIQEFEELYGMQRKPYKAITGKKQLDYAADKLHYNPAKRASDYLTFGTDLTRPEISGQVDDLNFFNSKKTWFHTASPFDVVREMRGNPNINMSLEDIEKASPKKIKAAYDKFMKSYQDLYNQRAQDAVTPLDVNFGNYGVKWDLPVQKSGGEKNWLEKYK